MKPEASNFAVTKKVAVLIVSVPEVVDCTVEGVYDEILTEAIKATIVLTDNTDQEKGKEKILSTCRNKLTMYKVPQILEFKKRLDVNQSGKKVASPSSQKKSNKSTVINSN